MPESAESGFELKTHAFKFENFASGYDASRLTPELVARMFGKKNVCIDGLDGCVLTTPAQVWMETANASMELGRCEGFAVLSQMFFLGHLDPKDFGADDAHGMELYENYALQRELAYWFSTQLVTNAVESRALMPRDAVRFMAEFMQPGSQEFYRIGMAQRTESGFGDAHSLTPIAFERGEKPNIYYVHVYDNNFPDEKRQIHLDVDANTWEYQGVTDLGPIVFAGGEELNNPLYFAPTVARDGKLPCPFCDDSETLTATAVGVTPLMKDGDGNEVGLKKGKLVEEGGGKVSPGFATCVGERSTIQLSAPASDKPLEFTLSGGKGSAQSLFVQGSKLGDVGSVQVTGELSGDKSGQLQIAQNSISLQAGGGSSQIVFYIDEGNGGRTTEVRLDVKGSAGDVTVSRDPETGALKVSTSDSKDCQVSVSITGHDSSGSTVRTAFSITGTDGTSALSVDLPKSGYSGGELAASLTVDGETTPVDGEGCADGVKNGKETDVDCGGGKCGGCEIEDACITSDDCAEGTCAGANAAKPNTCADSCGDGVKNGNETGVDCGGLCIWTFAQSQCALGEGCKVDEDCTIGSINDQDAYGDDPSTYCLDGVCVAAPRIGGTAKFFGYEGPTLTLTSGDYSVNRSASSNFRFWRPQVQGDYTVSVSSHPYQQRCEVTAGATGTATGGQWVDDIEVTCTASYLGCSDGKQTGQETDVDCGGPDCAELGYYCAIGQSCAGNGDCGGYFDRSMCANNVCAQRYSFSGTVSTPVPVTLQLTPGGDKGTASASPREQVIQPTDESFKIEDTRVTGDYALSVAPQVGVSCAFTGLPASPITQADEWVSFSMRCSSCGNGTQEGLETDVDCGGTDCVAQGQTCAGNQKCGVDADCGSGSCVNGLCEAVLCTNGSQDSEETDVDCGGSCVSEGLTCALTKGCNAGSDCTSGICDTTSDTCVSCSDGQQNGSETGTDCGGTDCRASSLCALGDGCAVDGDCATGICDTASNTCVSCADGLQNGNETGTDCGGADCRASSLCALGAGCGSDSDCATGICDTGSNTCVSCSDGLQNGSETGTDCGGADCRASSLCSLGAGCASDSDCTSGICDAGSNTCVSCSDGLQNGNETGTDCGGVDCRASSLCAVGQGCGSSADCEAGNVCENGTCTAPKTWSIVSSSTFSATTVEDATAIASGDVWASGDDYLAHYTGTWSEQQPLGAGVPITAMFAHNDGFSTQVWVAGDDNALQQWNGSGWFSVGCDITGSPAKLNDIHGDGTTMFVVGNEGQVAKMDEFTGDFTTSVGGFPLPPVTSEDLYGVFVIDDINAFAVGNNGVILTFDGGNWSEVQSSPTSSPLRDVWAVAADDVWAVGDGGTVVHYDGVSWSTLDSGVTADLKSVWAADANNVFMAGTGGTVLFWDGSSFTPESAGTTADLGAVFGFDTTRWAMGTGTVLVERP